MAKSFIELSKTDWIPTHGNNPTLDEVNTGCMQRIALATEKMAGNYTQLQNDTDYYKEIYKERGVTIERLYRQISNMKGQITKLKKKMNTL